MDITFKIDTLNFTMYILKIFDLPVKSICHWITQSNFNECFLHHEGSYVFFKIKEKSQSQINCSQMGLKNNEIYGVKKYKPFFYSINKEKNSISLIWCLK